MPTDATSRLAKLLREVADAHHDAFAATGGEDPEWPTWYAAQVMPHLAGTEFLPTVTAESVPWLTVEQMTEADRLAIEVFGITLLQMMEHAGSALAELVTRVAPEGTVTVLAGGGNNGGGGLCAARHLVARGRDVELMLASGRLGEAADHHLTTLAAMGVMPSEHPSGDVAVDALVGYGLSGALRGRAAELARWANSRTAISLDFPSGFGFEGAVRPVATLTLALPKESLRGLTPLYLADLGLPAALWQRMGLDPGTPFVEGRLVRVELTAADVGRRAAALAALAYLRADTVIGVGTGSTVAHLIDALGAGGAGVTRAVATSIDTEQRLLHIGISPIALEDAEKPLALYVDGADEIDRLGRAIKGGDGAHASEKRVAQASSR